MRQGEYSPQIHGYKADSNFELLSYKHGVRTSCQCQQNQIRFTQSEHSVWYISHISKREQKPNIKNLYQIRGIFVPLRMERRLFEPQSVMMSEASSPRNWQEHPSKASERRTKLQKSFRIGRGHTPQDTRS